MAIRNGEPFLPPQPLCPAERDGDEFTIVPEKFRLVIADGVTDGVSPELLTDTGGLFHAVGDTDSRRYVELGIAESPYYSSLAKYVRNLAVDPSRKSVEQEMGEIFCDRVKECRGVDGGECWALGNRAVEEVLEHFAKRTDRN